MTQHGPMWHIISAGLFCGVGAGLGVCIHYCYCKMTGTKTDDVKKLRNKALGLGILFAWIGKAWLESR